MRKGVKGGWKEVGKEMLSTTRSAGRAAQRRGRDGIRPPPSGHAKRSVGSGLAPAAPHPAEGDRDGGGQRTAVWGSGRPVPGAPSTGRWCQACAGGRSRNNVGKESVGKESVGKESMAPGDLPGFVPIDRSVDCSVSAVYAIATGWLTRPDCMKAFNLPRRILIIHTVPAREGCRIPRFAGDGKRAPSICREAPRRGL